MKAIDFVKPHLHALYHSKIYWELWTHLFVNIIMSAKSPYHELREWYQEIK